jgi:hypothetical protein
MFTALFLGRRGYAKLYYHHFWVYVSLILTAALVALLVLGFWKGTRQLRFLGLYSALIIGALLNPLVILGKAS